MFCFAHSMEVVRIHSIANTRKMKVTVYRQQKMEKWIELSISGSKLIKCDIISCGSNKGLFGCCGGVEKNLHCCQKPFVDKNMY